jgi:hypothetical protein
MVVAPWDGGVMFRLATCRFDPIVRHKTMPNGTWAKRGNADIRVDEMHPGANAPEAHYTSSGAKTPLP